MNLSRAELQDLVELALRHRWRRCTDRFPMCMGRAALDKCTCRRGVAKPDARAIVDAFLRGKVSQGFAQTQREGSEP